MRLPIVAGPLRGRWWLPQSRGKILRILGGTYEPEQTRLFQERINAGATVFDIGAHVGYYTLLSSVLVGERGRVCAFEPNPTNNAFLRRHVAINARDNITLENVAVSDSSGNAWFAYGTGSGTGHLSAGGSLDVRTIRIDDYCSERNLRPQFLKIDVEGAELDVLRGAAHTLESSRPVIFLSTHGARVHGECVAWLRALGYTVEPMIGNDVDSSSEVLCT